MGGHVFFFFFFNFYLCWVFVAMQGLSLAAASGSYSSLQLMGSLLQRRPLLQALQSGLSSCATWA